LLEQAGEGLSAGPVWPLHGLDDDLRPKLAAALAQDRPCALVTIADADGGPRGIGSQMVVTETESWGFLSGGCIETDVARHARATLADREARHLVYGRGSPWIDTRLPCGGRLDLLVERIEPGDPAIADFVCAYDERRSVRYQTDGISRWCAPPEARTAGQWVIDHVYAPAQRLVVFGSDPIALAIAALGSRLGWPTVIVWPDGPVEPPGLGVSHRRETPTAALAALAPDPHTAIAIATHDFDHDEAAILGALSTRAGYIGVLGARRRIPDRLARLHHHGASEDEIARLRMPIGLPLGAATPWEIAVSVTAQIIAERRAGGPAE
jgi:xanthine dehydrogenase accessory factor